MQRQKTVSYTGCSLHIKGLKTHLNSGTLPLTRPCLLTLPFPVGQAFKHMKLWGPFLFKPPHLTSYLPLDILSLCLPELQKTSILPCFSVCSRDSSISLYIHGTGIFLSTEKPAQPQCLLFKRYLSTNTCSHLFIWKKSLCVFNIKLLIYLNNFCKVWLKIIRKYLTLL